MQIYFSTVVRHAPVARGGEVVRLDWNNKRCLNSVTVYPRDPAIIDPNPRGNSRGGRGIEIINDKIYVASYHSIEVCNKNLDWLETLSHNNFAGLHETCLAKDGLWITSTAIDAAVKIDYESGAVLQQFWPREDAEFARRLNLTPLTIDKTIDNRCNFLAASAKQHSHLHLNSITLYDDNVYSLFSNYGAIVNLTRSELIAQDVLLRGGHSLKAIRSGLAFVNSTQGNRLLIYDLTRKMKVKEIDLLQYEVVKNIRKQYSPSPMKRLLGNLPLRNQIKAQPLFWRGLAVHGDHVFIGMSPAAILCINYQTEEFVDYYCHTTNVREAIHGLELDTEEATH